MGYGLSKGNSREDIKYSYSSNNEKDCPKRNPSEDESIQAIGCYVNINYYIMNLF